jgi:DNA-directed RNA polymerase specialized sigma24 family protein
MKDGNHKPRWTDSDHVTDEELITQFHVNAIKIATNMVKTYKSLCYDDVADLVQDTMVQLLRKDKAMRPYWYMGTVLLNILRDRVAQLRKCREGVLSLDYRPSKAQFEDLSAVSIEEALKQPEIISQELESQDFVSKVRSRVRPEYQPIFDYLITHPGRRLTNKYIAGETGWDLSFVKKAKMNIYDICRTLGADRRRVAMDERRTSKRNKYGPEVRDKIIDLAIANAKPGEASKALGISNCTLLEIVKKEWGQSMDFRDLKSLFGHQRRKNKVLE